MNARQKVAQELLMKEERVSAWESHGLQNRDTSDVGFCEIPKVEYWYLED